MTSTRQALLDAALPQFDQHGYDATTVAQLCQAAGASNGSFFHHFGSKEGLAGTLFVSLLRQYHAALEAELADDPAASEGIARLVRRHLSWVVETRPAARFLFEQHRAAWLGSFRDEQAAENAAFGRLLERWRAPRAACGALRDLPLLLFVGQCLGPAQLVCRAWLSGEQAEDPLSHAESLSALAVQSLVGMPAGRGVSVAVPRDRRVSSVRHPVP